MPSPLQPAAQRLYHVRLGRQARIGHRGDAAGHGVTAGEEACAPQRDLAPGHEHHPALMCLPEPFGLGRAAGKVPRQRARLEVDRDWREPQFQPGGKGVLAGIRQPLRIIAGHPDRGCVQVGGDDLQFPPHHHVVEALAGAVPVGGDAGVVGDPVVPHGSHPNIKSILSMF